MPGATVNEQLLHEAIAHAVALQRYNTGALRQLIAILNKSSTNIASSLAAALQRLPPESFTVQRLDSLLASVRQMNAAAYEQLANGLAAQMRALTAVELGYQAKLFTAIVPPQVLISFPLGQVNAEQVYAAAMARPFQGQLMREWASSQATQAITRLRNTVRSGYVEQKTTDQIVRDVRGTRAAGYEDGVMAVDRRNAEALVRTALGHTAAFARNSFMRENDDLIKEVEWVSTLDTRTTETCILRDGLLYENDDTHAPVGHTYAWGAGPGQIHWNCRSTSVPVVKSFAELGLDLAEFNPGTRASMDGQVPAGMSYGVWLAKQSAARQDDVLGPTRGRLFRSGKLDVSQFANAKGRWLTLDQLAAKGIE